jgi:hypothetical protein
MINIETMMTRTSENFFFEAEDKPLVSNTRFTDNRITI